ALGATQHVRSRYTAIAKVGFVYRYAADSHKVLAFAQLKARCFAIDYERGHTASSTLRIHRCKDTVDACSGSVGRPLFVAADDVIIAFPCGVRLQASGV